MNKQQPGTYTMDDTIFDYTFSNPGDLEDILGMIEQKAAGGDLSDMGELLLPQDKYTGPLALQFQPHPSATDLDEAAFSDATCAPSRYSYDGAPRPQPPAAAQAGQPSASTPASPLGTPPSSGRFSLDSQLQQVGQQQLVGQAQLQYTHALQGGGPLLAQVVMMQPQGGAAGSLPLVTLPNGMAYSMGSNSTLTYAGMMPPPCAMQPQHSGSMAAAHGGGRGGNGSEKPQISHSTVEKQRRDRINTLIDELRELVPPSASTPKTDGLESRRPKHVVLADTITLLKNMQRAPPLMAMSAVPFGHPGLSLEVKPDASALLRGGGLLSGSGPLPLLSSPPHPHPLLLAQRQASSGVKSNGSASDQEDMDGVNGAPQLPNIPMRANQNAGVSVEKGPDCMYVQVKCRDRRGLLSDIINALRILPLEIRTASVTTTSDGCVRDVFEVKPDCAEMAPEEVQNMVHDALFQPYAAKRARGVPGS